MNVGLRSPGAVPAADARTPERWREIVVVFVADTQIWYLRGLRRGFRHCFAVVNTGGHWVALDGLSHHLDVRIEAVPGSSDIAALYRAQGQRAVRLAVGPIPRRIAPLAPLTCVEVVKRAIGVHARRIFTPWQLFRYFQIIFLETDRMLNHMRLIDGLDEPQEDPAWVRS